MKKLLIATILLFCPMIIWAASYDIKETDVTLTKAIGYQVYSGVNPNKTVGFQLKLVPASGPAQMIQFTCAKGATRMDVLHNVVDTEGNNVNYGTGFAIQYYPDGVTKARDIDVDPDNDLYIYGRAENLREGLNFLRNYKTGQVVFQFWAPGMGTELIPTAFSYAMDIDAARALLKEFTKYDNGTTCDTGSDGLAKTLNINFAQ